MHDLMEQKKYKMHVKLHNDNLLHFVDLVSAPSVHNDEWYMNFNNTLQ